MKKLTRVRLINWHRFYDVTVDIGDSALISGENGAGKSTFLDAIQFVVTCSASHFNKAAHENGKRKLTGYVRCKTGREDRPYERTGEVTSHIALEFYEESKKRYFIVGAVIDSATEGQETVVRYLMDNVMLEDSMFKSGKRPRNIADFRTYNNKKIKMFAKTQIEGRRMIKQRFGRIEDKFFQLIPKALAFKPIDDIKDFVYSYVLDEKEVNIDSLRENVRSYQDLECLLDGVRRRIEKLTEIQEHYMIVDACIRYDRMYEYFLAQADLDMAKQNIEELKSQIKNESYRFEELKAQRDSMSREFDNKDEIRTALQAELQSDSDYQAIEKQETHKKILEEKRDSQLQEREALIVSGKKALMLADRLGQISDVDECVIRYGDMLRQLKSIEDVAAGLELVDSAIAFKKNMKNRFHKRIIELETEIKTIEEKKIELNNVIENLKKHRFAYPHSVELLKSHIEQDFIKMGRTAQPRVLCELLEITDERWRNAVEGYMNTQRFYLIVEPENFDIALGTYEKMRREKKAYGVGLINTAKLDEYSEAPEGSLATVVTSKSMYAKKYINMILGKVHMCSRADELKHYPVSITPDCMRYQNHVASAIKPDIYQTPYIGKNALKVQYDQAVQKKQTLDEQLQEKKDRKKRLSEIDGWLDYDADMDVRYKLHVLSDIRRTDMEIEKCNVDLDVLKKNSTIIEKQIHADEIKKECDQLRNLIARKDKAIGACENQIENYNSQLLNKKEELSGSNTYISEIADRAGDDMPVWQAEYEKQMRDKTLEQFSNNFDRRRKANNTQKATAEDKMKNAMVEYKTAFDFGAAASLESYPEYALDKERLEKSELLSYEEKAAKARIAAEEEFREQFLSKLQENMKQAQGEFKELNKALKGITFSNERYEFVFSPSSSYGKYYDMIMDDFNIIQGESIFSGIFHETHKEVIDELFAKLALDQDNGAKTLEEFTDYRTYMDYDIRITHDDGNYSLYSKVCEEKSGGETQTPFYVTVAASFVQMYSNNIGGEAVGLVMFDEAFNNMDDERIGAVLEFMNRLPLQIIIAAPPDKIQYIGPQMQETLLVMTDDRTSYVEEYRHAAGRK